MKKRNIENERKIISLLVPITIIVVLMSITTFYYFVAIYLSKNNLNLYISGILAGATGGLWSLGIQIGYKIHRTTIDWNDERWKKRWNDEKSFNKHITFLISNLIIFFIAMIIFWYFTDLFNLF